MKEKKMLDKFYGALAFSAIGDALGWPMEFRRYPKDLRNFVEWEHWVGSPSWGYRQKIRKGEYSDDTQLTLSVARCIDAEGNFKAERFAYLELPLWLSYERGGGKTIKAVAKHIIHAKRLGIDHFSMLKGISYRNAGANGAAMRILPIALVNKDKEKKLYQDGFLHALLTHGHPRAILGALIYASAVRFLLNETKFQDKIFFAYMHDVLDSASSFRKTLEILPDWISQWDQEPPQGLKFWETFQYTIKEARGYLKSISDKKDAEDREYYQHVGALEPQFRGSGISTISVALYLFVKYFHDPQNAILTAANMLGSDTDTIASFVGGLFGAYYGLSVIPEKWLEGLQDKNYILKLAHNLHDGITEKSMKEHKEEQIDRYEALSRIREWEITLYAMSSGTLGEGSSIVHPALGRGKIKKQWEEMIPKTGHRVKFMEIRFDCGQTCTLHHKILKNGKLNKSFSYEINQILPPQ